MRLSEFCKKVLPPFLFSQIQVIRNRIKYRKLIGKSTITHINPTKKVLCVLGNGPSLSKSVENYADFMRENDCLVVNYFANTNLYEQLRPNYYLYVDPVIYLPFEKMGEWQKSTENLADNLIKKTCWELNLILPIEALKSEFVTRLRNSNNEHIHIFYLNNIRLKNYFSEKGKFKYWDKNLIAPPAQTVMNTAVYLGLFFNYPETYAFGIDSNFFESFDLDQETNILYANDSHFYGNRRLPWYIDGECTKIGKLHEIAECFVIMFENYWELRKYADYKGLKVYNASEFSMVDAFERKKPLMN